MRTDRVRIDTILDHYKAPRMDDNSVADWRRRYALGIDEIDTQHGKLFSFIDDLDGAIGRDVPWLALHDILEQLHHWAEIHFSVEEALMDILDYPERNHHRRAHLMFVRHLESRRGNVLSNELAADTAQWLRNWLREHIGIADRHYADFFHRRLGESAGKHAGKPPPKDAA